MDQQLIRKQLLSISAIVNSLLADMDNSSRVNVQPKLQKRVSCSVCDLLFTDDDPDNGRGVHSRCYKRIQRENKIQESEEAGILLPKQKAGRKKLIDVDAVIDKSKNLNKKPGRNSKDT
jgi:hypothetical protein